MKGLVFAGCSFTWGQGLYYYSGLETLVEPKPYEYDRKLLSDAHIKYMEAHRFARLIANEFNTFEFVVDINGGSEDRSFSYLEQLFDRINQIDLTKQRVTYNEIEYIILQTSEPIRNNFTYNYNGEEITANLNNKKSKAKFYEWLIEVKKPESLDEWLYEHIEQTTNKIKQELMFYEEKGIKTILICWTDDYLQHIKNDIWLYNRYLKLNYNDFEYESIRQLMNENPEKMIIEHDYDNFGENTPKDHHPSMECHRVIADNIINKINKDLINNYDYDIYYDSEDEILQIEHDLNDNK